MFKYKYITDEKAQNLKIYKYVGCDNSFLYNNFFSPLAEWNVKYVYKINFLDISCQSGLRKINIYKIFIRPNLVFITFIIIR